MLPLLLALACQAPSSPSTPTGPDAFTATGETGETRETGETPPGTVLPLAVSWRADPEVPTRVELTWPEDVPGEAVLTWTDDSGAYTYRSPATGRVVVAGLPASSEVDWTLEVVDADRVVASTGPQHDLVADPPSDLPPLAVVLHDEEASELEASWFLASPFSFGGTSYAAVYDAEGRVRWWRRADDAQRIFRAHLSDDGTAVLWGTNQGNHAEDHGRIVREPIDGSPSVDTLAPAYHHDFVETADGYAFLAHVDQDTRIEGRLLPMTSDVIRLATLGATGAYEDRFSFFEQWPDPVSQPCSHSTLSTFVPGRIEWTHSNSIVRAPDGDGWWILPRYLDQVARVYADGTLGPIIGGLTPTIPWQGEGLPMSHGHFSDITPEGHLLIFDNGDHVHPDASRVVELEVDEANGVVRTVWSTPEPEDRFVGFLGDARRLPGGNTLIVNPNQGIFEVAPDGALLWEARHSAPNEMGRVEVIPPWTPPRW